MEGRNIINNNINNIINNENVNLLNISNDHRASTSEDYIIALNKHIDLYLLASNIITEAELFQINANVLNNPRFFKVFEHIECLNYKYLMAYLSLNMSEGRAINGIKETLRTIELKKAKLVYIAYDCGIDDYSNVIKKLCEINEIPYIIVSNWTHLRDILFKNLPTSLELEEIARIKGKPVKITPKCNSAAVFS